MWFTHPKDVVIDSSELVYLLNQTTHTFSSCEMFTKELRSRCVTVEKVSTAIPGADPALFRHHSRSDGAIGFCSGYVPRKNPDRILELVHCLRNRELVLVGRHWEHYERIEDLRAATNFTYRELPYDQYPSFYDKIDVFVSPSRVEGGPIPVLEAMISNVVPVVSRTGFAEDLIAHGENGYVFDIDAPVDEIASLIERAYTTGADIRATVEQYSWERYSRQIQREFCLAMV